MHVQGFKPRPSGPSSIGGHGPWLIVAASNRQENKSRQAHGLQKVSDSAAHTLQATAQRAYSNQRTTPVKPLDQGTAVVKCSLALHSGSAPMSLRQAGAPASRAHSAGSRGGQARTADLQDAVLVGACAGGVARAVGAGAVDRAEELAHVVHADTAAAQAGVGVDAGGAGLGAAPGSAARLAQHAGGRVGGLGDGHAPPVARRATGAAPHGARAHRAPVHPAAATRRPVSGSGRAVCGQTGSCCRHAIVQQGPLGSWQATARCTCSRSG